MTNWLIIKRKDQLKAENCAIIKETLKATLADKEALEQELVSEIGAFEQLTGDYNWFKKEKGKEAGKVARELKKTQESLNDTNNKATNEKTALLGELKAINILLKGKDTDKDELNKQVDSIKDRLNTILTIEGRDVETVLEARQAQHLQDLKDTKLILNPEEKKALDFSAGYYYWHSKGDHDRAKADKEALEQYLNDNKDKITNDSVLFSVNITLEHYKEEEQHSEDKHKFLKDLADINNKYAELETKYKDKEAELVDAQEKLILTEKEKKKISDETIKKLDNFNKDLKSLTEINTENYKKWSKEKEELIKKVEQANKDLRQKIISEKDFIIKLGGLQEELNGLNAKYAILGLNVNKLVSATDKKSKEERIVRR